MADITELPTSVELSFGDGKYWFALGWPQLLELERVCGHSQIDGTKHPKSVMAIHSELSRGLTIGPDGEIIFVGTSDATSREIQNVVRFGLVGGGKGTVDGETVDVTPHRASELLEAYGFPARPLAENAAIAFAILNAAIFGRPEVGGAA